MSTTAARQTHIEQVLIEATSFLLDRARVQLEREAGGSDGDTAASDLRRLLEVDKALRSIRHELGMPESGAMRTIESAVPSACGACAMSSRSRSRASLGRLVTSARRPTLSCASSNALSRLAT